MTLDPTAPGTGGLQPPALGMGEIAVARDGGMLRTFLGSCVGLALHDRRLKLAGLAHIVLPDSGGGGQPAGKYADTAVKELLRRMRGLAGGGPLHLTAKVAGGAKMFPFQTGATIGDQNVLAVERLLAAEKIAIVARCCGGDKGRRMAIDVASGAVTIQIVGIDGSTVL